MPIYEYQCGACGHQESGMESINAPRIKKCPSCGKRAFERLISAAAFHLKGGGWYATDFRDKGKKDKKTADAEDGKAKSDQTENADKTDKVDKADKADKGGGGDKPAKAEKKKSADKKD